MFERGPFLNPAQLAYHSVKCVGKLYKPDTQYNKGVGGGRFLNLLNHYTNSYDETFLQIKCKNTTYCLPDLPYEVLNMD